jgi:hypothetical protein
MFLSLSFASVAFLLLRIPIALLLIGLLAAHATKLLVFASHRKNVLTFQADAPGPPCYDRLEK